MGGIISTDVGGIIACYVGAPECSERFLPVGMHPVLFVSKQVQNKGQTRGTDKQQFCTLELVETNIRWGPTFQLLTRLKFGTMNLGTCRTQRQPRISPRRSPNLGSLLCLMISKDLRNPRAEPHPLTSQGCYPPSLKRNNFAKATFLKSFVKNDAVKVCFDMS